MKLVAIIFSVLLSSCSNINGIGNRLFPTKDLSKNGCNGAPVKIVNLVEKNERESKSGIITNYYVLPKFNDYELTGEVENHTNKEIKLNWNKSSFINFSGSSFKILTGSTLPQDQNKDLPIITIPPSSKASNQIYPAGLATYYQGRWINTYMTLDKHVGEKFGIYTNINGKGSLVQFQVCDH